MEERREHGAVDVDELFELAAGDPEIVGEILAAFREEYGGLVAAVRQGIEKNDPEQVQDRAHALKGVCATLGARGARDLAFELEKAGKGRDLSSAAELFRLLEALSLIHI